MISYDEKKAQEKAQRKNRLKREIPHLYGFKWYRWARAYFESTNKMNLLVAANQISKSSTLIRKNIDWATDKRKWPKLWPKFPIPRQFWYLYPSYDIATIEFQTKWVPEFMPKRGQFISTPYKEECDDPIYGWKAFYEKRKISHIVFKSGLTLYFKAYAQNVHNLQASSVHMISADEELPEELYDELNYRRKAVEGYFNMVFTATRNQIIWLLALEGEGELEKFPNAFKMQISAYDCQVYEDGTPGHWPIEKIKEAEADCKSQTEIERRVLGRFVTEVGRKYPAFSPKNNFVKVFPIPKDWRIYGGVDIGSGGAGGHPTGMGLIAVRPDNRYGVVFEGWRGDNVETTSGDALDKYVEMCEPYEDRIQLQVYDPSAKDFGTIATRCGIPFIRANNKHDEGESIVNTLFQHKMLDVFDTPELRKLGIEFMTLQKATPKKDAKDDFIDGAVRYPALSIPWDFTAVRKEKSEDEIKESIRKKRNKLPTTAEEMLAEEISRRRGDDKKDDEHLDAWDEYNAEIDEWNECYG